MTLSEVANFVVPNGHAWKVGLSKVHNDIWFNDGWHAFVEHHSICNGYLLVFGYSGFSNFNIIICDATACEIEYPCNDRGPICSKKCLIPNEAEAEDDTSINISSSRILSLSSSSLKSKVSDASATQGESSKRPPVLGKNPGMKRSRDVAFAVSPNSKYHYETRDKKIKMEQLAELTDVDANESRRGKLDKHRLSYSHELNELLDGKRSKVKSGEIQLEQKCEGVETITSENLFAKYIPMGFSRRDNNLKAGDVCVFELINNNMVNEGMQKFTVDIKLLLQNTDRFPSISFLATSKTEKSTATEKEMRSGSSPWHFSYRPSAGFFKIILRKTLEDKKIAVLSHDILSLFSFFFFLMIPVQFMRDYSNVLLNEVNLIIPNGLAWRIGLTKSENRIYFHRNWNDFMEHYSIREEHFLVFEFIGFFTFGVRIFAPSGCEIHYPSTATTRGPENNIMIPVHQSLNTTTQQCKAITSPENERAVDACRKFRTERPCFKIILRELNLRSHTAYVPAQFAREVLKEAPRFFKLQVPDGREWNVKANQRTCKRMNFGKGWIAFRRENDLKENDVCVFELIRKNVFKVYIFRDKE
ncbi:B3 domain-containing transcription factor VRN1-like [Ricinus communis]|uniref:B3 domain-containing transcription factor VRN1-like n=1 Tax=Ricinus communis TaxID=3988 RepID=UPI00201AC0F5|nr:B3 domain-containing transcription factor VRN1-like [Ricinus communis]